MNASFLRKPGTGIGQVTWHLLRTIALAAESREHSFVLFLEEDADLPWLPERFEKRVFKRWYRRDDLLRKWLWERGLGAQAARAECDAFFSLYQSSTVLTGMPHLMLVHDIIPELFPAYQGNWRQRAYWKAVKKAIRSASRLLTVSRCTRHDVAKHLSVPLASIDVAHPGVDEAFAEELSRDALEQVLGKYGLDPGFLYHGGGLELRKNTALVLRAYAELRAITASRVLPPLVISGTIHHEKNRLATPVRRLVRELGLEESVRLLGHVPGADLPALYQGARAFVFPSRYEGFGLPVLEAMASGAPVITSRVSSLPEVGGESVLYVNPDDCRQLTRTLKRLLDDPEQGHRLALAGKLVAKHFTWDAFTKTALASLTRLPRL